MKIDELLDETLSLIEADLKKIRAEQAKAPAAIGAYAKVLIGYVQTLVMLRSDQLTAEQREKERLSKLTKEELDAEAEKALKKVRDSK